MAERDRPAVHIDPIVIGTDLALPRQHDRRERLVDLDEINVVDRQPGTGEHLLGGRDRRREHQSRIVRGERELDQPRPGPDAEFACTSLTHHDHRGRAVGDLR